MMDGNGQSRTDIERIESEETDGTTKDIQETQTRASFCHAFLFFPVLSFRFLHIDTRYCHSGTVR